MKTHKRDNLHGFMPLCWCGEDRGIAFRTHAEVDLINCVDCLRMLAKSAVQFGNGRRARRS